ncbi:hypothetical protein HMI56_003599 [Coelomomyces lativittatus]|nr:hypothetical protein HMI56_003599 [Coelomomyces lativittatus]
MHSPLTLCCNQAALPSRGPPIFCVQGSNYHVSSTSIPRNPQEAGFAQLFILDSNTATSLCCERYPNLDLSLLSQLYSMLADVNPFVSIWRNMYSMCQEYELSADKSQGQVSIQLIIGHNKQDYQGCYNLPSSSKIV